MWVNQMFGTKLSHPVYGGPALRVSNRTPPAGTAKKQMLKESARGCACAYEEGGWPEGGGGVGVREEPGIPNLG